jgi:GTP-binding protein
MSKKLPIVAIVGRANVGKSSLFNAILQRREAIVAREAGTTRDSVMAKASIELGKNRASRHEARGTNSRDSKLVTRASTIARFDFWLVDTAGMKDAEDDFEFTIQEQILQAADSADVIWVVVEAGVAITEDDRRVAKLALKSRKPVFLVVNKIDQVQGAGSLASSISGFERLGIKEIIGTSTTQHRGIEALLEQLANIIPKVTQDEADDRLHIALLGRPNVGKSYLFNTLAKKQQAIVADRAGTTRDINRTVVKYQGREIELMDTAGIRRAGKVGTGIEHFSVLRSLAAIEQADICLLLMDANELNTGLDQKIAGMVKDSGKGLVLVVSKWDAAEDKDAFTRDALAPQISATFDFVPWAPLIFTSAVTGQNVTKLFDLAQEIDKNRATRIPTPELNRWLRDVVNSHPPAGLKNRSPKLNYMVQEDDNPTPAFKVFGSQTRFIHWSYRRYMERNLRIKYNFEGSPIEFWFIEKHESHKHGSSPTRGEARPARKART